MGDENQTGVWAAVAIVLKFQAGKGAQKLNLGQYPFYQHQI